MLKYFKSNGGGRGGGACLKMTRTLMMMIYILCKKPCWYGARRLAHLLFIASSSSSSSLSWWWLKCFPESSERWELWSFKPCRNFTSFISWWMQKLSHFLHAALLPLLLPLCVVPSNQRGEISCSVFFGCLTSLFLTFCSARETSCFVADTADEMLQKGTDSEGWCALFGPDWFTFGILAILLVREAFRSAKACWCYWNDMLSSQSSITFTLTSFLTDREKIILRREDQTNTEHRDLVSKRA